MIMKITVLDMDTASRDGDISLAELDALGEVKIFGQTGGGDTASVYAGADRTRASRH